MSKCIHTHYTWFDIRLIFKFLMAIPRWRVQRKWCTAVHSPALLSSVWLPLPSEPLPALSPPAANPTIIYHLLNTNRQQIRVNKYFCVWEGAASAVTLASQYNSETCEEKKKITISFHCTLVTSSSLSLAWSTSWNPSLSCLSSSITLQCWSSRIKTDDTLREKMRMRTP